jgi:hypothetical protein
MSDLVKAQNMPQFNWCTCWTSLDANGMPDNLIKVGLKQPDQIKKLLEKGAREITGHVAPDQVLDLALSTSSIRSSTMSLTTLILCQIVLKCMI